jgi:hypothetical protein
MFDEEPENRWTNTPSLHLRQYHYIIDIMLFIILRTVFLARRSHRPLTLGNLALRHQLEIIE